MNDTDMNDPELRTPEEWAEDLREAADGFHPDIFCRELLPADCRELADRMDDLAKALRLLKKYAARAQTDRLPSEDTMDASYRLLAKYATKEDGR